MKEEGGWGLVSIEHAAEELKIRTDFKLLNEKHELLDEATFSAAVASEAEMAASVDVSARSEARVPRGGRRQTARGDGANPIPTI